MARDLPADFGSEGAVHVSCLLALPRPHEGCKERNFEKTLYGNYWVLKRNHFLLDEFSRMSEVIAGVVA